MTSGAIHDEDDLGTALVVEDDEIVRGLVALLLEDEGFEVTEAEHGGIALEILEDFPPSVMVLDLMMPTVDGLTVLRQRRERNLAPDTRILVLTAKTDARDEQWCWELGADEFMTKPFDGDDLVRMVVTLGRMSAADAAHRREVGLREVKVRAELDSIAGQHPRP